MIASSSISGQMCACLSARREREDGDVGFYVARICHERRSGGGCFGFSGGGSDGASSSGWSFGRGWSSVFVEVASLPLVRGLGARGALFVVFDFSGAEGASFRLGSGQAGKYLRGVFSYMDSGGTRERVFAQSKEVVRRKGLPSVVVPIFGGEGESSSSSVSISEEGEALEMVSRSLSQAQERLSLMRNRRSSGSGARTLPPPRFSFPSVLSESRVQPPASQGSRAQIPQSPQAQGTSTQQSDGAPSQLFSRPPTSQGGGARIPQSPQAQGTSAQQSDGAPSQPSS